MKNCLVEIPEMIEDIFNMSPYDVLEITSFGSII